MQKCIIHQVSIGGVFPVNFIHKYKQIFFICKQVTAELLPALEEHLRDLESGKKTAGSSSAV